MKISVIIPHHYGLKDVDAALKQCVSSMVGHDEIIILGNDGMGYGPAVNEGLRLANGDHFVVSNNDCYVKSGSLRSLALHNKIAVPNINPPPRDDMPRPFFCIPKIIYEDIVERYGYFYDERFEVGYWEDDDLIYRIKEMGIEVQKINDVQVEHLNGGGLSMKQMGEQKFYDENKERYTNKWEQ